MQLTLEDGDALRQLQFDFDEDAKASSLPRYVLGHAPASLAAKLVNKEGAPSEIVARRAVQAITTTTVAKVCLRPSPTVVRNFMEVNFTATRYAQNFVTGTNRSISSWNHLPEDVREEFVELYRERTWDDPIEERVAVITASATKTIEHFTRNPYQAELAELEVTLKEKIEAYELLVAEHERSEKKKKKRPKRPSSMAREFKKLRDKARKWKHRPDLDEKKIARFVRLHDHMRMLSAWEGSKTGNKAKEARSYVYDPITLAYPGVPAGKSYDWNALCCCLLDERNLSRVVAGGERLDRIAPAYRQCMTSGVTRFTKAKKRYLEYLGAKGRGQTARKAGPPQIKKEADSFYVQKVELRHGGPDSLEEGLDPDGRWSVRCNACGHCDGTDSDQKVCHGYRPYLLVGGMQMSLDEETAARGIRISRSEYRRIKKIAAHGGRLSEVTISRVTHEPRKPGAPEPDRTWKRTRGTRKRRKRADCGPKVRYFASVVISDIPAPAPRSSVKPDRVLGIDPGARKFLTLSNGVTFPNIEKLLEPYITERLQLQRRLSRWHDRRCPDKLKGRKYRAVKRRHAEASAKVARMRRHIHEQVIDEILSMPFDVVALEDTTLQNLTRSGAGTQELPAAYGQAKSSRVRNRMMLAQGIGNFRLRLVQRAKKCGKIVVLVDPAYTSQTCNECGEVHTELGSDEEFVCPRCGHRADRDVNAALNMRDRGIEILERHGLPPVGGLHTCTQEPG